SLEERSLVQPDPPRPESTNAEDAIRRVVRQHYEALDGHDWDTYNRVFSDDAEFVTITGDRQQGIDQIVEGHRSVWSMTGYKDSSLVVTSITVRILRPDVAIARATTEITYNAGMDRRTSTPLFVLTKSGVLVAHRGGAEHADERSSGSADRKPLRASHREAHAEGGGSCRMADWMVLDHGVRLPGGELPRGRPGGTPPEAGSEGGARAHRR